MGSPDAGCDWVRPLTSPLRTPGREQTSSGRRVAVSRHGVRGEVESMVALTIGKPTYNEFDGVYFTVQALRLYQDLDDTELVVVDNYGCDHTKFFVEQWVKGRYVLAT